MDTETKADEPESLICQSCETPLEHGDLRCSICGQAAPASDKTVTAVSVKILRCTGCGAAIAYDAKRKAPACSFCNSLFKLETVIDPMEQTDGYLPFTVSTDEARRALKEWLGSLGWFRPSDLRSASRLQELKPLWWVAWVFDADAMISWAADSNHNNRRSAWAPHAGQTNVSFRRILASASRGLSEGEAYGVSQGMNLDDVRPEPTGATDANIEQFDVQRSQARQQVGGALQSMSEKHVRDHEIPGTRYRNVRCSVVVTGLVTHRLSLPAYVMAYEYKSQLYRVVISGQDARLVVGKAPYSTAKIAMVVGGAILAALLFFAIIAASSG